MTKNVLRWTAGTCLMLALLGFASIESRKLRA